MTQSVPIPSAIIYDWDNTLADTWPVIVGAINATLKEMGHAEWSDSEARARIRKSLRDSFPELFGNEWTKARDIFYAYIKDNHLSALLPLEGADNLTKYCHQKDVPQFILSNKTQSLLSEEVAHLGWQDRFIKIVGADTAEHDKPHPAAISYTLNGSGLTPSKDIWFVGDTSIDMECAHLSHLLPVAVRPFTEEDQEFNDWTPALHFESPEQLMVYIQDIGL